MAKKNIDYAQQGYITDGFLYLIYTNLDIYD